MKHIPIYGLVVESVTNDNRYMVIHIYGQEIQQRGEFLAPADYESVHLRYIGNGSNPILSGGNIYQRPQKQFNSSSFTIIGYDKDYAESVREKFMPKHEMSKGGSTPTIGETPPLKPGVQGQAGKVSTNEVLQITKKMLEKILSSDENLREFSKKLLGSTLETAVNQAVSESKTNLKSYYDEMQGYKKDLAEEALESLNEIRRNTQQVITIKEREKPDRDITGIHHEKLPLLIELMGAGNPQILIGPTQSGKSASAQMTAEILEIPFTYHAFGPTQTEARLMGYPNAVGAYVPTELYLAVKYGMLILLDEIDTANPTVLIQMNNGVSNGTWSFPRGMIGALQDTGHAEEAKELEATFDKKAGLVTEQGGIIKQHDNFRMIWSANTWGKGATMDYVGRNPIDASTLARLDKVEWDYDDGIIQDDDSELKDLTQRLIHEYHRGLAVGHGGMEMKMTLNNYPDQEKWVNFVQRVRRATNELGLRDLMVTPSHSLRGANNLNYGIDIDEVIEVSLFAGVSAEIREKILEAL